VLRCVATGLGRFQEFVLGTLNTAPNVVSVKTHLTIRAAKTEGGLPLVSAQA
jgi:hypothetical protein